jgi:hypothetical protein
MLSLTILSLLLLSTSPLVSTLPKTAPIQVLTHFYPLHLLTDLCQPWICGPDKGALYTLGMGLAGVKTSVESVRDSWVLVEGMYLCYSLPFPLFDYFLSLQLGTFFGLFEQKILVLLAQTHLLRVLETHGTLLKACIYVILFSFPVFDHFCLCNWALF